MFYLALKQMMSKKGQTALIFLGISFGTMIYIIVAGLQLGMRQFMIEQLLNNTAHILISGEERFVEKDDIENRFYPDQHVRWTSPPNGKREESRLRNPQGWFAFLAQDPHVVAYAPRFTLQAIATKAQYKATINLLGIIPQKQMLVSGLEDYMREGSLMDLSGGSNSVILSSKLLKKLGLKMGSTVHLSNGLSAALPFRVAGEIHLGNEQIDETFALVHIRDAQKLDQSPGRITDIAVSLTDMDDAGPLASQWGLISRDKVQSWEKANAHFMEIIKIQDLFRYIITATILLVAGFGIYNVLSIMISQKQREIAILRSVGFGSEKILELFFVQGLLLGIAGGILGMAFGYGICRIVGSIELSFEVGKSNHLWVSYDPMIYVVGFLAAFCSALVAGLLPSYKASRLTPLEIIRRNA